MKSLFKYVNEMFTTLAYGKGGVESSTSTKHLLLAGLILAMFHPPKIGFLFALLFVFKKETRRVAQIVFIWTTFWMFAHAYLLGFFLAYLISLNA